MSEYVSYLPHLNAILNSTSAVLLVIRLQFYPQRQHCRASHLPDLCSCSLDPVSVFVSHLPLSAWRHAVCGTRFCASCVFHHSIYSHRPRGCNRTVSDDNLYPCVSCRLCQAPADCTRHPAVVAIRFSYRCNCLFDVVSDLSFKIGRLPSHRQTHERPPPP